MKGDTLAECARHAAAAEDHEITWPVMAAPFKEPSRHRLWVPMAGAYRACGATQAGVIVSVEVRLNQRSEKTGREARRNP